MSVGSHRSGVLNLIQEDRKTFREGTHRAAHVDETIVNAERRSRAAGITRVADITGLDRIGLPVFVAVRPNARSRVLAHGKGLTFKGARASALMEALELDRAERCTVPLRFASLRDLENRSVVDVSRLPKLIRSNFHEDLRLLWVEGYDLVSGSPVWVPYDVVHLDFTVPMPPGTGSFVPSSNGLASGNTLGEAVCHALCELIERDAAAVHWHNSRDERLIDLRTVTDDGCLTAIEMCEAAGIVVRAYDITSDIPIPTFVCELSEPQTSTRTLLRTVGRGTHPDKGVALLRAITEAAQGRLSLIAGNEGGERPARSVRQADIRKIVSVDFSTIASHAKESILADIQVQIGMLNAAGMPSVVVVPLGDEEDWPAVARVVVPGLEGIHTIQGYSAGARATSAASRTGAGN